MGVYVHGYLRVRVCVCVRERAREREREREYARVNACMCVCVMCARAYNDVSTYIHIYIHIHQCAGSRTEFARGKFKPKSASSILQALSCQFFACNLLVCVFLAFRSVSFSSKIPSGIFPKWIGRVSSSAKRVGF